MEGSIDVDSCPLRKALHVLGGKWNLIIIKSMGNKELRFGELKRAIPDVSEKVLIDKLKLLVAHGLIVRHNHNEVPPKVSYYLSVKGKEALKIAKTVERFGEKVEINF